MDTTLLLWINSHHTLWLDEIMWYASRAYTWIPLYAWVVYLLVTTFPPFHISHRKRHRRLRHSSTATRVAFCAGLLAIIMAVGLSDFISSSVLKDWIARPRPSHSGLVPMLHFVHDYHGGPFGFPSSHAANSVAFSLTTLLVLYTQLASTRTRNLLVVCLVFYVLLNCYSRMYLGVHYPTDILAGAGLGALFSFFSYLFYMRLTDKNANV